MCSRPNKVKCENKFDEYNKELDHLSIIARSRGLNSSTDVCTCTCCDSAAHDCADIERSFFKLDVDLSTLRRASTRTPACIQQPSRLFDNVSSYDVETVSEIDKNSLLQSLRKCFNQNSSLNAEN